MGISPHSRSGSAVFEYVHEVGWEPEHLCLVGVGVSASEAQEFHQHWPGASIEGFEPNPHSYEGLKDIFPGRLHQAAVSDKTGTAQLHYRHSWKNGSSLHQPIESHRTVDVKTVTLQSAIYKPETLLWIDAEGHELQVLQGAEGFLENVVMVNVEMTGRPRSAGWSNPLQVHEFLKFRGFKQVYTHSLRTVRGQFDAIYLRRERVNPQLVSCLDSLLN